LAQLVPGYMYHICEPSSPPAAPGKGIAFYLVWVNQRDGCVGITVVLRCCAASIPVKFFPFWTVLVDFSPIFPPRTVYFDILPSFSDPPPPVLFNGIALINF